jgi:hypothetical protein
MIYAKAVFLELLYICIRLNECRNEQLKGNMITKKPIFLLFALLIVFSMFGCTNAGDARPSVDEPSKNERVSFTGVISEINGSNAIVDVNEGEPIRSSGDKVSITIEEGAFAVGDVVVVVHSPEVMESYPLQINMISIEKVD